MCFERSFTEMYVSKLPKISSTLVMATQQVTPDLADRRGAGWQGTGPALLSRGDSHARGLTDRQMSVHRYRVQLLRAHTCETEGHVSHAVTFGGHQRPQILRLSQAHQFIPHRNTEGSTLLPAARVDR